jgi:hypothetical protein
MVIVGGSIWSWAICMVAGCYCLATLCDGHDLVDLSFGDR